MSSSDVCELEFPRKGISSNSDGVNKNAEQMKEPKNF